MSAGYSGTPLAGKLGVKRGHRVLLDGAPAGFGLDDLPDGVIVHRRAGRGRYDIVLAFTTSRADLERRLGRWLDRKTVDGAVWVAWPKRASKVATDVTEDVVRELALGAGVVDVKVIAVDETWSGLKLVTRLRDR